MALASRNIQSSRTCSSVAGCRRGVAPFRPVRKVAQSVRADAAAEAPKAVEKSGPNFKALRDINQIMQTLPHRCGRTHSCCLGLFDRHASVTGRETRTQRVA